MNFINRLYDKKISSKGLGLFRILFSLVLLCEVFRIFRYRQLYYDPIPFIQTSGLSAEIPFVIWMGVLFMLVIGAYTKLMALLNYIFIIIYISSIGVYEYHMDYTYTGVSFMLIFLSASKSYSVDRLREKLNYSNLNRLHKPKELTSVLTYWLIIFVGVGLVYLDSVFFKMGSKIWTSGLGMWYPASLPQMTVFDNQWLLNQEVLIKFLGYLTFAFEVLFPFLFWVKKLRIPFLIIGIGLHLGILLEFPIPFFALGVAALYILMVPNCVWKRLEQKIKAKTPSLTLFYDAECPLCMKTRIVLKHFDSFNMLEFKSVQQSKATNEALDHVSMTDLLLTMHAIDNKGHLYSGINAYKKAFLITPLFFPLGVILHIPGIFHIAKFVYNYVASNRNVERCTADNCGFLPVADKVDKDAIMIGHNFKRKDVKIIAFKLFIVSVVVLQVLVNLKKPFSNGILNSVHAKVKVVSSKLLGITQHGVFMDGHYKNYDEIFTVSYKGKLLPFYNEKGMPDAYIRGGLWVNFNFRVNKGGREANNLELRKGLERYIIFWAHKNNVKLNLTSFKLLRKEIHLPTAWELNVLHDNFDSKWETIGDVVWNDNQATFLLHE